TSTTLHPSLTFLFFFTIPPPPRSTLFPYTTLFRSRSAPTSSQWVRSTGPTPTPTTTKPTSTPPTPTATSGTTNDSPPASSAHPRSEEHTSELQSPYDLVCRLLLEKKKKNKNTQHRP